jgi:hypothetical protein
LLTLTTFSWASISRIVKAASFTLSKLPAVALAPARAFCLDDSHLPVRPLSGFFFHNRNVSVGLISYHFPASHKAGQDRGFCSALCQEHETVAFIGLGSTSICAVHCSSFHDEISAIAADFPRLRFRKSAKNSARPTTARIARSFCSLSIHRYGDGRAPLAPKLTRNMGSAQCGRVASFCRN